MFFALKSYFSYLLKSTNQYGVHSPFVYKLLTKCLYRNKIKIAFKKCQEAQKKNSLATELSIKKTKLLLKLLSYFQVAHILEIQTEQYSTTGVLMQGENVKNILTIINDVNKGNNFSGKLDDPIKKDIVFGDVEKKLSTMATSQIFDFIYFGKYFNGDKLFIYFKSCLELIHNDSMLLVNGIHTNKEVENTWLKIKEHPKVRVTLDMYFWGIVFFRKEQEKEHFIIRV